MLLIMRNLFIKAILVSFCFVSFNTQAFETTYLVCSGNNETNVFGFVVTFSDRLQNINNKRQHGHTIATAYLANSERNDFIERPGGSTKAIILEDTIDVYRWAEKGTYSINRVSGNLFNEWIECPDEGLVALCLSTDQSVLKSKLIGSCNKVSESEAKAKARQLYTPPPEPKRKF